MIYLDNSSTTRQFDEVTDLIYDISKNSFGNPSSLHSYGFEAANTVSDARKKLLHNFYNDGKVIFTSGGTESDNTALISMCHKMKRRGNKVITTKIEHPAILETCRRLEEEGFEVCRLDVDKNGYLDPQAVKNELDDNTLLVSIMAVNNEVGTIEPVLPVYTMIQDYNKRNGKNIIFHTDAVQAFGKLEFTEAPFDLISVSSHKIHGPKGIGALYIRNGIQIPPYISGGGQEEGYRSGTENVPGIAGFGLAAEISYRDFKQKQKKMSELNDYLRQGIMDSVPDVLLNGCEEMGFSLSDCGKRCPSILNLSFLGTRGEVILHTLEQDGIFVSTGSACSSHKNGDSHVLSSMSLNHKEIEGAIRFSLSEDNTKEEMDFVIEKVTNAVKGFRKLGSFR